MREWIKVSVIGWLLAGVLLSIPAWAGTEPTERWGWLDITPADGPAPAPRRLGTAIYDPIGQRVILFGGRGASGFLNDAWALDLATLTWQAVETAGDAPEPRHGHDAIYDPFYHRMVIWAGQSTRFYNDTRALDLQTYEWSNITPAERPTARYGSVSVLDPLAARLVTFAGFTSEGSRFQDTQGFALGDAVWQDLTPAGLKPVARCLHTGAYHPFYHQMIIYGGQRSGPLDDLWLFDLFEHTWTEWTPAARPPGRFFATSFVDPAGRFTVFGGQTAAGNVNETLSFSFETGQWQRVETEGAPSARNSHMGVYLPEYDAFLVFGGSGASLLNDLWLLVRLP